MCRMHWYNLILDLGGPCHANPPEGRLKFWNVRTVPRVRVEPHPLQDLQGIRCERQAPWLTLFRLWKGWHCSAFERGNNSQSCLTVHDSHCARTFLQLLPYLWWCMMMSRFGSWLILLQKHAKAIVFSCILANCTLYIAYSTVYMMLCSMLGSILCVVAKTRMKPLLWNRTATAYL